METYVFDDGGRWAAGFRPRYIGDCVCRAIAIATQKPYAQVHAELSNRDIGWMERRQIKDHDGLIRPRSDTKDTLRWYMEGLGWIWTSTMKIGSGCKVHLRADELPSGRIIARVSRHWVAVIDGIIHDTHDCSRDGKRCVYGYWTENKGPIS
jgi:hypothetical protein